MTATTPTSVGRPTFSQFRQGLRKSGILRALALSIIMGALSTGALFLVVSSPSAWMIATATVGGLGVGFIVGIVAQGKKGRQKMSFELTTLYRLCKERNYNEIFDHEGVKIFLGAIPNRMRCELDHLANVEGVRAILSVNESWEREPMGLSVPYTNYERAELMPLDENRRRYVQLTVEDHALLILEDLNNAADFIKENIDFKRSVYVHCRAGAGRSAMAVAAYLIKHQKFTVDQAVQLIKIRRPISTIDKQDKIQRLKEYLATHPKIDKQDKKERLEVYSATLPKSVEI